MQSVSARLREQHNYPSFVDAGRRLISIRALSWGGAAEKLGALLGAGICSVGFFCVILFLL